MKKIITKICILLFVLNGSFLINLEAQRQRENITRGAIAYRLDASNVIVSWRLLPGDTASIGFNIYRTVGVTLSKRNSKPVTGATWYKESNTSTNLDYEIRPVINGTEQAGFKVDTAITAAYLDIPLQIPADATMPDNTTCSYSANDCSAGDLDGDGKYEIILKWDPSNAKDNSQGGYTGNVYLDAYKLNGTRLWRIDLGKNIRAGAHYTQFMVYDFDGDGKSELACRTAPGTKDGKGNYLNLGPAALDSDATDYRNTSGYILSGPEYLTVFNGLTGAEMASVDLEPARGNLTDWGDGYGNRVDRFTAAVAYCDGEKPSIIMGRGYYLGLVSGVTKGRTGVVAYDWRNGTLSKRWAFSAVYGGTNSAYTSQGNHNLRVADVDNDGKDEIIYGSMAVNDDGTGLYSTGLGHGDAIHLSDMDPDRPGFEVFACHEEGGNGVTFRDAATGQIIWQKDKPGVDVGRGLCADISAENRGYEYWGGSGLGVYNTKGNVISSTFPSINHLAWWDGDLLRELVDGNVVTKWNSTGITTLLTAANCSSNNTTKSNPCLHADILGDWREEVLWRTTDNTVLRVFLTTLTTNYRFYSLMHDFVYRQSVAYQNVAYNQPSEVGFYLASDMGQFTYTDTTAFAGSKITLGIGAKYDSYVWSNGATTPTIEVDTTGVGYATKKYILTTSIHGGVFKDSVNVTFQPTSQLSELKDLFKVYPNPNKGKFYIQTGAGWSNVTITLESIEGKKIYSRLFPVLTGINEFNIAEQCKAGVYIIRIISGSQVVTRKIFIK